MENALKMINQRYSVRNYLDKEIEGKKQKAIKEFFANNTKGPMGNEVRVNLIHTSEYDENEVKSLIKYGIIKGAKTYMMGAVKSGTYAMEDFGYVMEKHILMLTQLGLGTCWLGGTFKRGSFAKKMNLAEGEVLPGISPIGYAAEKRTTRENVLRGLIGANKRKKTEELFFDNSYNVPLNLDEIGKYSEVLEAVRLGPSASNKQPWRIIKDAKGAYHMYLDENERYNNAIEGIKIQNIDMGIAMCHFEFAAKELNLPGQWVVSEPELDGGKFKYIVTWK